MTRTKPNNNNKNMVETRGRHLKRPLPATWAHTREYSTEMGSGEEGSSDMEVMDIEHNIGHRKLFRALLMYEERDKAAVC